MPVPTDNEQINLSRSVGASGCIFIAAGETITGKFWGFVVNTDAVVTVLVTSYDTTTVVNQTRTDLTGHTISQNQLVTANSPLYNTKVYMSSITCVSGDVMAYVD